MTDPIFKSFNFTEQDKLRDKLNDGIVIVAFNNAEGELRVMRCTTSSKLIPQDLQPTRITENKDQNLFRVFDVVKNGWRSFKFERIVEVNNEKVIFPIK